MMLEPASNLRNAMFPSPYVCLVGSIAHHRESRKALCLPSATGPKFIPEVRFVRHLTSLPRSLRKKE